MNSPISTRNLDLIPDVDSLKQLLQSLGTLFCVWRNYSDSAWSHGPIEFPEGDDVDGSAGLLAILDRNPITYCQYAEEYFESTIPTHSVKHLYDHKPLTESVVVTLNPEVVLTNLTDELTEIGYQTGA